MNSVPIIEIQRNDNTSPKKEIKDENKASENNQKDEISNSLSLSETENRTKKIVTVQEENINGNYGRIYIKESSSNREGDRFDSNTDKLNDKPIQERGKKKPESFVLLKQAEKQFRGLMDILNAKKMKIKSVYFEKDKFNNNLKELEKLFADIKRNMTDL